MRAVVSSRCSGAVYIATVVCSWPSRVRSRVESVSPGSEARTRSTNARPGISASRVMSQAAPRTSARGRLSSNPRGWANAVASERSSSRILA